VIHSPSLDEDMSEFIYRVIKSSWGVYAEIDCTWRVRPVVEESIIQVSEKLYLEVKQYASELEIENFRLGMSLMSSVMDAKLESEEPIVVVVERILRVQTDYQEEGLACAMMGWLSREFDVPKPDVAVTFDKNVRKYIFDFRRSGA
jgi:hypothetical protein